MGKWAEKKRIAYTTFMDLSQRQEVFELLREEVERVNRNLPPAAGIRFFINLHKKLDADEAELTRTKKLKRGFMEKRYSDLIQALFTEEKEIELDMPMVYQDGRKGAVKTTFRIYKL